MQWYINLNIRKKLYYSFGLVILISIFVGYNAYSGMGTLTENTHFLYNNNTLGIAYISRISTDFQEVRVLVRATLNTVYSTDSASAEYDTKVAQHNSDVARMESLVEDNLKKYEGTFNDKADEMEHKKLAELVHAYFERYGEFKSMVTAHNTTGAVSYMETNLRPLADRVNEQIEKMVKSNEDAATATYEKSRDEAASEDRIIIISLIVGVLIGIFTAIKLSNYISISINQIVERMKSLEGVCISNLAHGSQQLANGDLNVHIVTGTKPLEIASTDEIGILSESINRIIQKTQDTVAYVEEAVISIQSTINESQKLVDSARQGRLNTRVDAVHFKGSYRELINGLNETLAAVDTPLAEAGSILSDLANGDLTVEMRGQYNGAFQTMKENINTVSGSLNAALTKVSEAVSATASAAAEISSSSEQMAAGAQEQSSQTTEIVSAVEEMSKTIFESSKNTGYAAEYSKEASEKAREGARKIENTRQGMDKIVASTETTGKIISVLSKRTDQIGEITQVIDEIADQTNLLALNAAIEAARAGEQGRGFAVVADEVRKLAERTTKATKEIAETIKTVQSEAKEADKAMTEAGESVRAGLRLTEDVEIVLNEILKVNEKVADLVNQVAASSEEQSATAEQISKNIEGINNVTQQSAAGTSQIATAAEDLNRLTNNLQELISGFKLSGSGTHFVQSGKRSAAKALPQYR